jgi:hypothetical protein
LLQNQVITTIDPSEDGIKTPGWGIMEETILQKKYTIKKNFKSKFKEKMWCDKELEEKRKLRYYKDVINPNLEDQNYLFVFPSVKKKNKHC